jgi:hypothetical protein
LDPEHIFVFSDLDEAGEGEFVPTALGFDYVLAEHRPNLGEQHRGARIDLSPRVALREEHEVEDPAGVVGKRSELRTVANGREQWGVVAHRVPPSTIADNLGLMRILTTLRYGRLAM